MIHQPLLDKKKKKDYNYIVKTPQNFFYLFFIASPFLTSFRASKGPTTKASAILKHSNWLDSIFLPVILDHFSPFIVVRKHRVAVTHIARTHRYSYTNKPSAYSRTRTRSKTKRRCLIHESAESRGCAKDSLQIASFNRTDSL